MATGPWDPMVAGTAVRGRFRASHADREQVIDALKTAFVQGGLTKDELAMRTGQALAARTHAELTVITADIPVGLIVIQPSARPARKLINKKVVAWGACVIIVSSALSAAFLTYYGGFLVVFLLAFAGAMVPAKPSAPRRPGHLPSGGRR